MEVLIMSNFSNTLKYLREKRDWSKTKVAKHLGIGLSTYANWEYGYNEPDIAMINNLSSLYEVSTDYLIGHNTTADKSTTNEVDLETNPILAYGGEKATEDDMDIIKAIIARHNRKKNN